MKRQQTWETPTCLFFFPWKRQVVSRDYVLCSKRSVVYQIFSVFFLNTEVLSPWARSTTRKERKTPNRKFRASMARLLRASQNALRVCSPSSETQFPSFLQTSSLPFLSRRAISTTTEVMEDTLPKSPLNANIVRILRNEIQYQSEYAPANEVRFLSFPPLPFSVWQPRNAGIYPN